MKSFNELTQQEILALAISSEEEDGRIYVDFAEGLRDDHPDTARVFSDMAEEENDHRRMLIDLYASKFGKHIPLIRRQDVRGFVHRKKLWQVRLQGIEAVRQQAKQMEQDAARFYQHAASRATDADVRRLLGTWRPRNPSTNGPPKRSRKDAYPTTPRARRTMTPSAASSSRSCSPGSSA